MTINGPILSSTSVFYICCTIIGIALILMVSWRHVDPSETEAVAKTCVSQGMVARLDVGGGHILVYCQKPDQAGPPPKR